MNIVLLILKILSLLLGGGALLQIGAPLTGWSSASLGEGAMNAVGWSIPSILLGILGFAPGLIGKVFPAFTNENGPAELADAIAAIKALIASPRDWALQKVAAVQCMECAFAIAMAVLRPRLTPELLTALEAAFRNTMLLLDQGFSQAEPPRLSAQPLSAIPVVAKVAGRPCFADLVR